MINMKAKMDSETWNKIKVAQNRTIEKLLLSQKNDHSLLAF